MTGSDRGSAFLESVIASVIVCLVVGETFQVISDGAARERQSQTRSAAYLVAQSELADVGADIPLAPGETSGVSGPFAWRVQVTPFETGQSLSAAGTLLRVAVDVGARQGGPPLASLHTLRLARAGRP